MKVAASANSEEKSALETLKDQPIMLCCDD